MNYGEEIKAALRQLREIHKILDRVLDTDEKADEFYNEFEERMEKYDKNVGEYINGWITSPDDVDANEIVRLGLQNQDRWGTEPRFILDAIEDVYNIADRFVEDEEEDED